MNVCADCGEEAETIECADSIIRCGFCATAIGFCWNCGAADACYSDSIAIECIGACSACIKEWNDDYATERHASWLWDTGR